MRALLISLSIFLFCVSSAVSDPYIKAQKQLTFKVPSSSSYTIRLNAPQQQINHDACSLYSYTLKDTTGKYGSLFMEHINLQSNCSYNGDALGYFMYEFKDILKLKSLKKIDQALYKNLELFTYKVNDTSYVNIIHTFKTFEDTFIVDYKGTLYTELRKQIEPKYHNPNINKKRFISSYDESLVRKNIFKGYFNRDSEDFR